jgi:aspartate/methionine/tyrosine aminotransferase
MLELAKLDLELEIKQRMMNAYKRENNYYLDMAKQIIATYGISEQLAELLKAK